MPPPVTAVASIRRQAEAILAAGGGWNPRTRAAICALAARHGIAPEQVIESVVGNAADPATVRSARPDAPSVDAPQDRAPPTVRDAGLHDRGAAAPGLAGGLAALVAALAISVSLAWLAVDGSFGRPGRGTAAGRPAAGATASLPPSSQGAAASTRIEAEPDEPRAPSGGARAAPVAAIYARVPGFGGDLVPSAAPTALAAFAGSERELLALRERLAAAGSGSESDRDAWARVVGDFVACWPMLEDRRRRVAIEAIAATAGRIGSDAAGPVLAAIAAGRARETEDVLACWRQSGAVGLRAVLDRAMGDGERAFGAGALRSLAARGTTVGGVIVAGDPAGAEDAVETWLLAITQTVRCGVPRPAVDDQLLALLETLLRRGAPLDRPGTAADAAGAVVDALLADAGPTEVQRVASAFAAWMLDPGIEAIPLHGLTSVLATRRPSPWWNPWLVSDARAERPAREASADRYRLAAASVVSTAPVPRAGRVLGARQETVDRWARTARAVLSEPVGTVLPSRISGIARVLGASEALLLLERGRVPEAEARLALLEEPVTPEVPATRRWKDGIEPREVGSAKQSDGVLRQRLRGMPTVEGRADLWKSLKAGAFGTDLGPGDAAELAFEALRQRSAEMRRGASDAIVDQLDAGPAMITALAWELPSALEPVQAVELVERLCGRSVPPGAPRDRLHAAVVMLLDLRASLVPAERHAVDDAARELAAAAGGAAGACGGNVPGSLATPEQCVRAWFDAALAAASESLPAAACDRLRMQAGGRRRLAGQGPRLAVAELVGVLEVEAALAVDRRPRSRASTESVLREASEGRRAAPDAVAQLECTARAILRLQLDRVSSQEAGS